MPAPETGRRTPTPVVPNSRRRASLEIYARRNRAPAGIPGSGGRRAHCRRRIRARDRSAATCAWSPVASHYAQVAVGHRLRTLGCRFYGPPWRFEATAEALERESIPLEMQHGIMAMQSAHHLLQPMNGPSHGSTSLRFSHLSEEANLAPAGSPAPRAMASRAASRSRTISCHPRA